MSEIITLQDLNEMCLDTEHGVFTPMYEYDLYDNETQTYQGFKLVKTAEQVYSEWLESKNKIQIESHTLSNRELTTLMTELILQSL